MKHHTETCDINTLTFLVVIFCSTMHLDRKFLEPKTNTNMADHNADIDDVADVLIITALLADEKCKVKKFSVMCTPVSGLEYSGVLTPEYDSRQNRQQIFMTHVLEIGARNTQLIHGTDFRIMCHGL